jgi:hypothetical protein
LVPVNKKWDRLVPFGSCAEKCNERMKHRNKQHAKITVEVVRTGGYIWEEQEAIYGKNRTLYMGRIGGYIWEKQEAIYGKNRRLYMGRTGCYIWEKDV